MNKKFWIAQALEPPGDHKKWHFDNGDDTTRTLFYSLICLFTGWVLGILTIVFLSGG